jgi:glutamine synthetase
MTTVMTTAQRLAAADALALTWVDNAGITRVKVVPAARVDAAARHGVGMSPVFDVFLLDDSATSSPYIGGPTGDLRLVPDLEMLTPLAAQPGWAWAPADRRAQDGTPYPGCQRTYARRMVDRAAARGLRLRAGIEIEWFVGRDAAGAVAVGEPAADPGGAAAPVPVGVGPAYGMARVVELSDYLRELLRALAAQGVEVLQLHPEYSVGQLELSTAPTDPVTAADLSVLIRATIRAVGARYGLVTSFAPVVYGADVGNGGHVHLSLWREERNLCQGGQGPGGMTAEAEHFVAGLLRALPELCAIGAPSVASYLRLVPSHWAGAYQCWGLENREAALRFVSGAVDERAELANVEVKCADLTANPYLLLGALIAAGLAGVDAGATLPPQVTGDPALLDDAGREASGVRRLPRSLADAVAALEKSALLREALGDPMFEAVLAVRRAEIELFANATTEQVVAATRFRH